jgi:membrane peptidoglycan carboxypeptidase
VPKPRDETEMAATMIGQGRVLASPLAMALVAAAVADGTARSPVLVTDPTGEGSSSTQLDQASLKIPVDDLRALMREVVTDGTGKKAEAPGGVSGKTGTAEFGDKAPFNTHAWFIGFSGDIAVSVIVEGDIPKRSAARTADPDSRQVLQCDRLAACAACAHPTPPAGDDRCVPLGWPSGWVRAAPERHVATTPSTNAVCTAIGPDPPARRATGEFRGAGLRTARYFAVGRERRRALQLASRLRVRPSRRSRSPRNRRPAGGSRRTAVRR